jgi:uncharacterized protein (TIGR02599 family)
LVELLVAVAVLLIIMGILLSATTQTSKLWRSTTAKMEQFRAARDAFEEITRHLSQATLNTYWDYDNAAAPTRYVRQSELRFISGNMGTLTTAPPAPKQWPTQGAFFQAPLGFSEQTSTLGLENLLNTWGYYIEFGDDSAQRPAIITPATAPLRNRYRLMEMMEPSESLTLYKYTSGIGFFQSGKPNNPLYVSSAPPSGYTGKEWFTTPLNSGMSHVLAENIIALVILPKLSQAEDSTGTALAPTYSYDSTATNANATINPKNQLPPVVEVAMVAIDEASAIRLAQVQGTTMPDFGQGGLFANASTMETDLGKLQATLINQHVTFHVFTTNVAIKGAKWSRAETN